MRATRDDSLRYLRGFHHRGPGRPWSPKTGLKPVTTAGFSTVLVPFQACPPGWAGNGITSGTGPGSTSRRWPAAGPLASCGTGRNRDSGEGELSASEGDDTNETRTSAHHRRQPPGRDARGARGRLARPGGDVRSG